MKNIKKILAVILAVLMTATIPMTAFAAPASGTPIGTQYEQDAFVMEASRYSPFLMYEAYAVGYEPNENWIDSEENSQWEYYVKEDGTLCVGTTLAEIDQNLVIPSTLDGKTVTEIGSAGTGTMDLDRAPTLSVTIPDTVTAIGHSAFRNRGGLRRVVIPTSVKSIHVGAFDQTNDIELYYTGTNEQWNSIVVWSHTSTVDPANHWAVTGFNWLEAPYASGILSESAVKAVHFNVDPDTLEPLVEEEEEPAEPSLFEKFISGVEGIIGVITGFFKGIVDFFGSIF